MLQDRECQRYYQPWLAAHGSSLNVAAHVASIAQLDLQKQGYEPLPSRDRTLTAFAQLVALRLDTRRCMVSLIDAKSQYVLAEATRSHSLSGGGNGGDPLWLGSAILSRADAVCEHCMVNTCQAAEENGRWYTAQGLIVNDCQLDDRFKKRSYVQEEHGVRFYAGVPLMSRNGHMIGALAVSDDRPRHGLSADHLRYMQETAQAVMEHLEWARDRVDRFKGERIVRGMATFIEDCASVREGTAEAEKSRQVTPAEVASGVAADPERPPLSRPRLGKRMSSKRLLNNQQALSKVDGMSRMYGSAADILRDSTLADGCAIFGATADSGRTSNLKAMPVGLNSVTQRAAQPCSASDSERHDTNTSDSDSSPTSRPCKIVAFSVADKQAQSGIEDGSALTLGTLERYFTLFPHGRTFSFNSEGHGITSEEESASEREPEQDSPGADRPPSPTTRAKARAKKRQMDHKELLKKIPGAQTVVFLPLYDHAEEKLIAGIFLWTSVVGRMLLNADLGHLRAFGNCIVSEVTRMNMQRNEAAKTTFIASMSHELRSPLHGILGASEFLMETATDGYQSGLITSIVTCGKTLLDTLNHVLDYSKINKLGRTTMRRRAKANKPVNLASDSTLDSLNLTADIDLGILVEEVAEAVTAGHTFKRLPESNSIATANPNTNTSGSNHARPSTKAQPEQTHPQGVVVLLDISPTRNWVVRIQPGALRRIIMNLLGNALKYTTEGFVAVSLRAQETSDHNKVNTLIRVVDSGKGMSESFMKDRLFVPFSQEDPFQPGTGLGLSIVKQIVDSLGGSVEVRSEQGIGTEIDVHLQLTPAHHAASDSDSTSVKERGEAVVVDHEMLAVEQKTRGKQLIILDPTDPEHRRPANHHASRFQQTLREICTGWFGMNVARSTDIDHEDATIYLFCEPPPIEKLRDHLKELKNKYHQTKDERAVPIVVVCQNDQDAINMTRDQQSVLKELGSIVEVIPQPCGPRKLAKVFNHCLRRAEELARSSEDAPTEVGISAPATSDSNVPAESASAAQVDQRPSTGNIEQDLRRSMSAAISFPAQPPLNPETPSLQSPEDSEAISPLSSLNGPQLGISPPPRVPAAVPAQPQSEAPRSDPTSQKQPTHPQLHLLLVDDNKINRQLLVMFTKRCQFTYREAENGQEAVDLYRASLPSLSPDVDATPQARFDFVLMDISMPVLDGMEATRRIRELEREAGVKRTKVIALTGLASEKAREEAVTCGIDVFLPKPVRFGELRGLLVGG